VQRHALARQVRRQAPVGSGHEAKAHRHVDHHVEVAPEEGEPHRLVFDAVVELDALEHRQLAALEGLVPIVRIRGEDEAAADTALDQHEGAGTHRVLPHVVAIPLHDLARDRRQVLLREDVQEVQSGSASVMRRV
jgi:hypothetical protein